MGLQRQGFHSTAAHEYDAMAEDFEKKEHALFGDDGFEKIVNRVAKLEQAIGIQFIGLPR